MSSDRERATIIVESYLAGMYEQRTWIENERVLRDDIAAQFAAEREQIAQMVDQRALAESRKPSPDGAVFAELRLTAEQIRKRGQDE